MLEAFKKILIFSVVVFLSIIILRGYSQWLGHSRDFTIRKIEIRGNELIPDSEILKLADIQDEELIWHVNLAAAENTIKDNPFIASVQVSRRLPDILDIRIREKQALALLKFDTKFFAIDDSGLVLPSKPGRLYDMPVISGSFRGVPRVGKTVPDQKVQAGLDFLKQVILDRPQLYKEISEVIPDRPEGLVVVTSHAAIPVLIGEKQHASKIRYLEAVLSEIAAQPAGVRYIDLRYQGQVILGMRT